MSIKSSTRPGKRGFHPKKSRAKDLLGRVKVKVTGFFKKVTISSPLARLPHSPAHGADNDTVSNSLFQGALVVTDVAKASRHPPQVVRSSLTSTGLSSMPGFDTGSVSLEQPNTYSEPPLQFRYQQVGPQVAAENKEADDLLIGNEGFSPATEAKEAGKVPKAADKSRKSVLCHKDRSLWYRRENSVMNEVNAHFFQFPSFDSLATENRSVVTPPSPRNLASSGTTYDTFGDSGTRQRPNRPTPTPFIGGLDTLDDTFVEPAIAEDSAKPTTNQREAIAKVTPGKHELLDTGYHLNPPPVLHNRKRRRTRRVIEPDSSVEGKTAIPHTHPAIEEQSGVQPQPFQPQDIPPLIHIEDGIQNIQLAMHGLAGHLENLFLNSRTHFWNAGVYAGRVATRDAELAGALHYLELRDCEIARLQSLLVERDAEIQKLRNTEMRAEHTAPFQNEREVETETSDLYGVEEYDADEEDGGNADAPLWSEQVQSAPEGYPNENEEFDAEEQVLCPAINRRRYQGSARRPPVVRFPA